MPTVITVLFEDDEKAQTFAKVMETTDCVWMPDRILKTEYWNDDAQSDRPT